VNGKKTGRTVNRPQVCESGDKSPPHEQEKVRLGKGRIRDGYVGRRRQRL